MAESWLTWLQSKMNFWVYSYREPIQENQVISFSKFGVDQTRVKFWGWKGKTQNVCWFGTMLNSGPLTGLAVGNQTQNLIQISKQLLSLPYVHCQGNLINIILTL